MRVFMLTRNDAFTVPGGDTIQMTQTKASLEKLGIEVEIGTIETHPSLYNFDLLHVFNWTQLEALILSVRHDLPAIPPIVLSPIFWFHTGHWFDLAVSNTRLWNLIHQVLPPRSARKIYEEWQQAKFRWGKQGSSFRNYFKISGRFLPNSEEEIRHLEAALGIRGRLRDRCTVVPNGIVRDAFDPIPEPSQSFYDRYGIKNFVIQVARIQMAKNQLALIEALKDTTVPLVFVGQPSPYGYEAEYVQKCYDAAQRRGNVYFTGPLPPEELPGIYALAAVHALPSWRETPGLASLEAAAAGCRIVSTSIGCAREYFGENAWYCNPGDLDSIRRAVRSALDASPSDQLRNLVLERYTWEAAARKTLEAYCMVLGLQ